MVSAYMISDCRFALTEVLRITRLATANHSSFTVVPAVLGRTRSKFAKAVLHCAWGYYSERHRVWCLTDFQGLVLSPPGKDIL